MKLPEIKTWYVENFAVTVILAIVWWCTGHKNEELLGAFAVFCGHVCTSMTDRLTEREAKKEKSVVECARWFWYFFYLKEVSWLTYFAIKGAWAAIAGVAIALVYPVWRRIWRQWNPLIDS